MVHTAPRGCTGFRRVHPAVCHRRFKLYKGNITKAGTPSPYSLYNESLASFTTGDLYAHHDAEGFINLFGLPLKVRAMKMAAVAEANKEK